LVDVSESREWKTQSQPSQARLSPQRSEDERETEALVGRMAAGDEHAMARLYDDTSRTIYGLALRIVREPAAAEDVTMEVYLQVWRLAANFDPQRGTVLSWMANMARSRALDSLRRRKASRDDLKERVDEVHNLSDFRIGPEMSMLEDERSRIVRKAMLQLSPDHREAIELAYFSGLTHTEAAIKSGLPLGTVKTRIRSGMSHLRKLLTCFEEVL